MKTTNKGTNASILPGEQQSRVGKRVIAGHFDADVAKALKRLALERDTTLQMLLTLAINDFLEKNGLGRLANETPPLRGVAAMKK